MREELLDRNPLYVSYIRSSIECCPEKPTALGIEVKMQIFEQRDFAGDVILLSC